MGAKKIDLEFETLESSGVPIELSDRNTFLENVLSSLPGLVAYVDRDLRYHYVNKSYERWFGLSSKKCIGHSMYDVLGEAAVQAVKPYLDLAFSGTAQEFESVVQYKVGGSRFIKVQYIPDLNESGSVKGLTAIVSDVSNERRREMELKSIVSESPIGIIRLDSNFKYLSVNAAYEMFTGYSERELLPKTIIDITHPDDQLSSLEMIQTFPIYSTVLRRFEKRYIHKSGKTIWGRITSKALRDETGEVSFLSIIEDITVLKEREVETSTVLETMAEGLIIFDEAGKVDKFNPSALEILGATYEELSGRSTSQLRWQAFREDGTLLSPDERPVALALRSGKSVMGVLMGLDLPDNKRRWVKVNAIPFEIAGNRKVACTFSDVTGVVSSSSDIKHIFEQSLDLMCITSKSGFFEKVSPSIRREFGYKKSDLLQRSFLDFLHPEDLGPTLKALEQLGKGERIVNFGNRLRTKEGTYRTLSWVWTPDLKTGRLYATGRDVTDQKKTEQLLVEAQRIAKIGSWRYEFANHTWFWSAEHFNIFEIEEPESQEELAHLYRERIHPEDRAALYETIAHARKTGRDFSISHRISLDNGKRIKYVKVDGKVSHDESGVPVLMSGTCQDLTDLVQAQEENRFILDSLKIGVWKFNPTDQSLFWDTSMYQLFGIKKEDFSGHYEAWESTLTPGSKAKATEELAQALRGEKEFDTVFEIQTKKSGRKFISGRGKVIRDSSGAPQMMYGVNIDVTDKILKERLVLEQQAHIEAIADNIPGPVSRVNREGRYVFANRAYETWFGLSQDKILGKSHREVLPPDIFALAEDKIKRALAGERLNFDGSLITTQGKKVFHYTTFVPLVASDGSRDGFFAIVSDITALKEAEQKVIQSSKLASLGVMSAGVAHEINNPLAIIAGSAGLLSKYASDPEKLGHKVQVIQRSCDRIAHIVKSLRKFSRSGDKVAFANHELTNLAREVIGLTEPKSKRHSASVTLESRSQAKIRCNEVEIEQVLVNLINNSVDAIQNLPERWVKLEIDDEPASIVLTVTDSGPGIPQHLRARLFEPFFTTKEVGQGTGLGLSISKGILDEHGATITVLEDVPNTCFEIRFPKYEENKDGH